MPSYPHREAALERKLTPDQIAAARSRHARFVAACQASECPLPSSVIHRSYCEALEEVGRGDSEEEMVIDPSKYERRGYAQIWQMMDWPT